MMYRFRIWSFRLSSFHFRRRRRRQGTQGSNLAALHDISVFLAL